MVTYFPFGPHAGHSSEDGVCTETCTHDEGILPPALLTPDGAVAQAFAQIFSALTFENGAQSFIACILSYGL
jgi:hypothetical protein